MLRPRVLAYSFILLLIMVGFVVSLATRTTLRMDVIRDRIDARRHHPVDAAKHGILFVQHARPPGRARREQAGQRGIAAEDDDDGGVEVADQVDRLSAPLADRERGLEPADGRSEEHTSELQSLMRISYAVFCLQKK